MTRSHAGSRPKERGSPVPFGSTIGKLDKQETTMVDRLSAREYLVGQALAGLLASGTSGKDVVTNAIALADDALEKLQTERPLVRRPYGDREDRRRRPADRRRV